MRARGVWGGVRRMRMWIRMRMCGLLTSISPPSVYTTHKKIVLKFKKKKFMLGEMDTIRESSGADSFKFDL